MGRILVYVTSGCSHCVRAKKLLDEKGLPYEIINLAEQPNKKREMVIASGRKTVPQIFFNYEHIGGADDLFALELDGILDEKIKQCMSEHPSLTVDLLDNNQVTHIEEDFEHMLLSILDAIIDPENGLKRKKKSLMSNTKKFKGHQMVSWIMKYKNCSAQDALKLGNELIKRHYCFREKGSGPLCNGEQYYILSEDKTPNILNRQRIWNKWDRKAPEIAKDLQKRMLKMSDLFITEDGRGVDYEACAKSAAFRAYRLIAMELQTVDLDDLKGNEAMAFWLNLYNALIIHANITVGPPRNMIERSRFFGTIGYYIGGQKYTLSEMEHAILRGNRKPPASFTKLFKKRDPRIKYVLELDPRIHFALVCGAKSCPPIRIYDSENLESALQWATEGFCSEEVHINVEKKIVTLSRIFQWYAKDFGRNTKEVLCWILDYLPAEHQSLLKDLLTDKFRVKYSTYDWDINNRYDNEDALHLKEEKTVSDSLSEKNTCASLSTCTSSCNTPLTGSIVTDGRGIVRSQTFQKWEIPFENIQIMEPIGKGAYGEVFHGIYKGTDVAVKQFFANESFGEQTHNLGFFQEFETLCSLNHPNILPFIGASYNPPHLLLVTRLMPNGSLYNVLKNNPDLEWSRRLHFAYDIAKGMNYLHTLNPPIIHRDLKGQNILVDENFVVTIADFGISKTSEEVDLKLGTLNWLAPEVLSDTHPYTTKADVFSYGMVLYEIATNSTPFGGLPALQVIHQLESGIRPNIPKNMDPAYVSLMEQCWDDNFKLRPDFSQIVEILGCMLSEN